MDHQHAHQHQGGDHPVILVFGQDMPEERGFRDLDADGAFGQETHLVDEDLNDGAEGERDHGEVGADHLQRRERQHAAEHGSDQDGGGCGHPERHVQVKEERACDVGADAEEARVTERHLAGVAHHDVQPEQQDRVNQDRFHQVDVIRVGDDDRKAEQQDDSNDKQEVFEFHGITPS